MHKNASNEDTYIHKARNPFTVQNRWVYISADLIKTVRNCEVQYSNFLNDFDHCTCIQSYIFFMVSGKYIDHLYDKVSSAAVCSKGRTPFSGRLSWVINMLQVLSPSIANAFAYFDDPHTNNALCRFSIGSFREWIRKRKPGLKPLSDEVSGYTFFPVSTAHFMYPIVARRWFFDVPSRRPDDVWKEKDVAVKNGRDSNHWYRSTRTVRPFVLYMIDIVVLVVLFSLLSSLCYYAYTPSM